MAHWSDSSKDDIEVREASLFHRGQEFRIYSQRICFPGLEYHGKISIIKREDNRIIFRIGGGSCWCGQGDDKYYRPEYLIGTVDGSVFKERYGVEYGKSTRSKGLAKAVELFDALRGAGRRINR